MAKTITELETIVDQLDAQVKAKDKEIADYKAETKKNFDELKASYDKQLEALKAESDKTEEEKEKEMKAKKAEEEEKEKQKDAQIMYLAALAKKPRIDALSAAFKGKVTDDILKIYQASWDGMTISQLDAEVQKIGIFAASKMQNTEVPYMPSTPALSASTKDELFASFEQKSVSELFGGPQ